MITGLIAVVAFWLLWHIIGFIFRHSDAVLPYLFTAVLFALFAGAWPLFVVAGPVFLIVLVIGVIGHRLMAPWVKNV